MEQGVMELGQLRRAATAWYAEHARELPWREAGTSPWQVLLSEVMSQQTPVARVAPVWRDWVSRWPGPRDLAEASTAEVLRAWGRLGYPRRALRLQECAAVIVERHGGEVPDHEEELLALPGVGPYTAGAVVSFAHHRRAVVLDTNIRRVLGRVFAGEALPAPTLTRSEQQRASELLPTEAAESVSWNSAVMELGALVCTARNPRCGACPLASSCRWLSLGRPADAHAAGRRRQPWHGTDRQARGRVLHALRDAADNTGIVAADLLTDLHRAGHDEVQADRALATLLDDGLIVADEDADQITYRLPGEYGVPSKARR